jgi:GT2 family glycosyltransferase
VSASAGPELTIAVPAFRDDAAIFARMHASVRAVAPATPLVVVDMSPDPGLGELFEQDPHARYIHFPESGGVSHSRNRLAREAQTTHVVFLDSDAFVEPGWLEAMARRIAEPDVAVVGARILPEWERTPGALMTTATASDWLSLYDLGDQPLDVPLIIGTSYAVDLSLAPDPPFDESLGRRPGWPLAMEENRLCEAVRASGHRVVYEPGAVVRHNIPADRASWRWMWRRAHTAGRETRVAGRSEPLPARRLTLRDRAFQAAVAIPFFAGMATRPRSRPG